MKLDAHQHFWEYNPQEYPWMKAGSEALKTNYLPKDLKPLLDSIGFDGCISVQARQMTKETDWLLGLAREHDFIKGVVGWVDLCSEEVGNQLESYKNQKMFLGVRHVLEDEPDDDFMLQESFKRGLSLLADYGLTYDLLIKPRHIQNAIKIVEEFPQQPFVVDHIAKPLVKDGILSPWREDIRELANHKDLYCKVSGITTLAAWGAWTAEQFTPYLDVIFDAFGPDRLMIGSDWPPSTLSGEYAKVMGIVIEYCRQFDAATQDKVLGGNCADFYGVA